MLPKMFCSTAVAIFIIASHSLASAKPQQGFGDNFLSENFGRVDFDSPNFMPEFNFEGFFKKIEAPAEEIRRQADATTFQFPEHESAAYSQPTFYKGQRYSEITSPAITKDALVRKTDHFNGQENRPFHDMRYPEIGQKEDGEKRIEDTYEIQDTFDYDRVPYQAESIRRLDGPFEPSNTSGSEPKRRLLKVKLKKPIIDDEPTRRNDDFLHTYEDKEDLKNPISDTVDDFSYPTFREESLGTLGRFVGKTDSYKHPSAEKRLDHFESHAVEMKHYRPSFKAHDDLVSIKKPKDDLHFYRHPIKPAEEIKSYQTPQYSDFRKPTQKPVQDYNKPSVGSSRAETKQRGYSDYNLVKKSSKVEERHFQAPQGFNNFPSLFQSSFEEPTFTKFSPPFGASAGFEDFMKVVGARDPFATVDASAKSDTTTTKRKSINNSRPGSYQDLSDFDEGRFDFPVVLKGQASSPAEPPAPQNGFFSNDYLQDFRIPSTFAPTQAPHRYPLKTTSYPVRKEVTTKKSEIIFQKTEPSPIKASSVKTPLKKPDSQPIRLSYRSPIQPIGDRILPTEEETTTFTTTTSTSTSTQPPTIYYKPVDSEDPRFTPGPVYYKPVEADTTTTSAPVRDIIEESVATAPKAPAKPSPTQAKPSPKRPLPKPAQKKKSKYTITLPKLKLKLPKPAPRKQVLPQPKKPLRLPKKQPEQARPQAPKSELRPPQLSKPEARIHQQPELRPLKPQQSQQSKLNQPQQSDLRAEARPSQQSQQLEHSRRPPQPPSKSTIASRQSVNKYRPSLAKTVTDIFHQHKEFLETRKGGALAQSTAVFLPYVLSLL